MAAVGSFAREPPRRWYSSEEKRMSLLKVALGRQIGPGLAAALVSAFATLMDPGFWAHNWDLALAVALAAFPIGRVARIGAVLVRPFAKIGGDAVLALAGAIERLAPRVASALVTGLLRLPGLAERALAPLTSRVGRVFDRLGGLTKFTVRVLGIQAVINAVTGMVRALARIIGGGLDDAWNTMRRKAIEAALKVVEPFSHLPAFLGGWARDAKEALQAELDGMETAAKKTVAAINSALAGVTSAAAGAPPVPGIDRPARAPGTTGARPEATPRQTADTVKHATEQAKAAADQTVAKGFVLPFRLRLAQARAEATKAAGDDVKVAREIRTFILRAIPRLNGDKLIDAYGQLKGVNDTLANAVKQAAGKVRGFTVPLALQVAQARAEALGKDTQLVRILQQIKAAAKKALQSGRLGLQGQLDAWNTLKSVNDQLREAGAGMKNAFKKVSTAKLTAGLGLDPATRKALRARFSQVGPGGTIPSSGFGAFGVPVLAGGIGATTIDLRVNLDGREIARTTTRHQQRTKRRNPDQRRGMFGGGL